MRLSTKWIIGHRMSVLNADKMFMLTPVLVSLSWARPSSTVARYAHATVARPCVGHIVQMGRSFSWERVRLRALATNMLHALLPEGLANQAPAPAQQRRR